MQLWRTTNDRLVKQRRGELFYRGEGEVGRGCYKQKGPWRKLGAWRTVPCHWLHCDSLSVATLLTSKEILFPIPSGSSNIVSLPATDSRYSCCWGLYWLLVVYAWELPFLAPQLHFSELWPTDVKSPHWEKPRCWERLKAKAGEVAEKEMVRWHYWLSGHKLEQTPRDSTGQRSLACCSPWSCKETKIIQI